MYTSTHFAFDDLDATRDHVARHGLAALVSTGPDGLEATHCPILFDPDAPDRMIGHLARPNPHWRRIADGARVLAVFRGPDAYISPTVYVAEPDVPTWNYAAVHVHGTWHKMDDGAGRDRILDLTVRHYEALLGGDWSTDALDPALVTSLTRGTVAFTLSDLRIEAADKASQDKCPADKAAVMSHLGIFSTR